MNHIARLLGDALDRDEVVRTARAQIVLRRWNEVVGDAMAERSQPERFDRGTVWVAVTGSAWAQELRMQKDRILARLRSLADDPSLFENIRFGVRPVNPPPPKEEPRIVVSKVDPELSIREIAERRLKVWRDGGGA
jgi:predicted nucleic acid-binding Zn ribbon protein